MSDDLRPERERWQLTLRLKNALVRRESPRVQMAFLVTLAGGSGFLASVALLRGGLRRMPVRYVLSVSIAYAVFLALLYAWILYRRRRTREHRALSSISAWPDADAVEALDFSDPAPEPAGFDAGEGHFGGAGASSSWSPSHSVSSVSRASSSASHSDLFSSSGRGGTDLDLPGDPDEWIGVVLAAAAAVLLGASIWIVALAPSLFAELLLDGVLSASLYRRLRALPQRSWLETAVRRTILPFLLAAVTLGLAGLAMETYAPEAKSLGGVLAHRTR